MPRSKNDFKKNDKSRSTFTNKSKNTEQLLFTLQEKFLKDKYNGENLREFYDELYKYSRSLVLKQLKRTGKIFDSWKVEEIAEDVVHDFLKCYYKKEDFKILESFGGLLYLKCQGVLYKDKKHEQNCTSLDLSIGQNKTDDNKSEQTKNLISNTYLKTDKDYVENQITKWETFKEKTYNIIKKYIQENNINDLYDDDLLIVLCILYYRYKGSILFFVDNDIKETIKKCYS